MSLRDLKGSITSADTVLFTVLLTVSILTLVFVKDVLPRGSEVIVEVNGKQAYTLSLNEDSVTEVQGAEGTTSVEIRNHKVSVTNAPCPDKICEKQGWIDRGVIVCLPNRVLVRISGRPAHPQHIDAITR